MIMNNPFSFKTLILSYTFCILPFALIAGILNSCSVISHLGTHTGLLSMVELENQLKEADKALLQKFSVSFE